METITLIIDDTVEKDVAHQDKEIPTIFRMHPETWGKLKGNSTSQTVEGEVISNGSSDQQEPIVPDDYQPPTTVKSPVANSKLFDFLVEKLPDYTVEYLPQPNRRLSDRRIIKITREGKTFTVIDVGSPNKKAIEQIEAAWKKATTKM